jgi:hypothetical protein
LLLLPRYPPIMTAFPDFDARGQEPIRTIPHTSPWQGIKDFYQLAQLL